jgi:hypothetical protein
MRMTSEETLRGCKKVYGELDAPTERGGDGLMALRKHCLANTPTNLEYLETDRPGRGPSLVLKKIELLH